MTNTSPEDRRKGIRGENSRRKGAVRTIKIEEKGGKEQEVNVRREAVPEAKEKSTWSWHEEFAVEWSETFIAKQKGKQRRKGE
jgi:hypothetical protein